MKPAKDFRDRAAAKWGTSPNVISKGKNSIVLNNPNDPTKYLFGGTIGQMHYGENALEIDTAWVPDTGAWQYKMVLADFNAYARDTLNAGTLVEYRNPYSNEWVTFQPAALNWVNPDDSRQQLALPQTVVASVNDDTLTWTNGYGTGKHFSYTTQTERLQKLLTIDSLADLPAPEAHMTGTLHLELELLIDFSANVNMWIDGVEWDKSSTLVTGNYIEFKNTAGETQWYLDTPYANDQDTRQAAFYQVRKQGANFYITVRVPKTWIDTAIFPIKIDPTVNVTVGASDDDAFCDNGGTKGILLNTYLGVATNYNPPSRTTGVRFTGINISGTATITSANIEFSSANGGTNAVIPARIGVDAKDNAPAWVNSTTFESEVTLGTNFQLPDKVARTYTGGQYYGTMIHASAELKALVQEIIDRPGWASGNAIRFVIQGYDGTVNYQSHKTNDWDTNSSLAARISIEYTDGTPPPTQELTVTFPFATTAEGFTAVPQNADVTLSYDGATGNPAGALKTRLFGRNKTAISWWKYAGTWESLGVPAGETVSLMRLNSAYTRCTEWNVVNAATIGSVEIWDSSETVLIATLYAGRAATGVEGSWVQTTAQADQSIGASYQASSTSIVIRIISNLDNGNNGSAAVSTYDDQYQFVITHTVPGIQITPPAATFSTSVSGGFIGEEIVTPAAATFSTATRGYFWFDPDRFFDDFNDNSLDTTKWTEGAHLSTSNPAVTVVETNNRLEITPLTSTSGSNYNGIYTKEPYDFTGGQFHTEVAQTGVGNTTDTEVWVVSEYNASDRAIMYVEDGILYAYLRWNLTTYYSASVTYNSTNHKWWRIRHDQVTSTFYWETSPDGWNWTALTSGSDLGVNMLMRFQINVGTWGSEASPGTAIFDNVNILRLNGTNGDFTYPNAGQYNDSYLALSAGAGGQWDSILWGASAPAYIVRYGDTYYMYYVGANGDTGDPDYDPIDRSLGLATSKDLVNWTKYGSNPIVTYTTGGSSEEGVGGCAVFVDNGTWRMYYAAIRDTGGGNVDLDIRYRDSTDGLTWSNDALIYSVAGEEHQTLGAYFDGTNYRVFIKGDMSIGQGPIAVLTSTSPNSGFTRTVVSPSLTAKSGGAVQQFSATHALFHFGRNAAPGGWEREHVYAFALATPTTFIGPLFSYSLDNTSIFNTLYDQSGSGLVIRGYLYDNELRIRLYDTGSATPYRASSSLSTQIGDIIAGGLTVTPSAATFATAVNQGAHSTPLIVSPSASTFVTATQTGEISAPFVFTPPPATFATASAGGDFITELVVTPAPAIFATSTNQGAHSTPLIVTSAPATFSTATVQGTHSTPFVFTPVASTFATAVNQGTHSTPFEFTPSAGTFATATEVGQVIAPFTPSAATFALTVNQGTHSFPVDLTPAPATFSASTQQGLHNTPFEFTPNTAFFATASAGGDFVTELVITPAPATFGTTVNQGTHSTPFVFTPAIATTVMASAGGQFYTPIDITPAGATFALLTNQGAHNTPLIIDPTASSFAMQTIVGSIETGSAISPPAATFATATAQGTHETPFVFTPSPATFATSVANGEIVAPVVVVPGAATFSLASAGPIVETGFVFTPAAATFTAAVAQGLHFTPLEISPNAVTVSFGVSQGTHYVPYDFTPSPAQMSMSAQQGTHYTPFVFTPVIAEFGADAILGLVISDLIVTPAPATFALASIDPTVFASVLIQPAPATFAMSTFFSETEFTPDPATFALVSQVGAIINPIEPVLYMKRDLIRVHDVQLNGVSVLAYNVLEALTGDEWGEGYVVLAENYDDGSPDTEFDRKVGADLSDGQQVNKTYRGAVTVFKE